MAASSDLSSKINAIASEGGWALHSFYPYSSGRISDGDGKLEADFCAAMIREC